IISKGKLVADAPFAHLQQRVKEQSVIRVEFKESVHADSLSKIKGVTSVQQQPHPRFLSKGEGSHWLLYSESGIDLREEISHYAKENNLTLLTLQVEETSLEEVFKSLTTNNNQPTTND
ncbi:MAG TPA: hypothetical protein VNJ07_10415, partial [Chitinophagales bacterium]|nr:hypothetical protein [Chitinophagales bacterium]